MTNKPLTISGIEKEFRNKFFAVKTPQKTDWQVQMELKMLEAIMSFYRQKIEELVEGLQKELYKKGFAANYLKNKMKGKEIVGYRRVRVFEIEESDLLEVFKKALKEESNIGGNGGASGKGGTGAIGGRDMEARGKDGNAR